MKALFDSVSIQASRMTTKAYSTSFSLGILGLDKQYHDPITLFMVSFVSQMKLLTVLRVIRKKSF